MKFQQRKWKTQFIDFCIECGWRELRFYFLSRSHAIPLCEKRTRGNKKDVFDAAAAVKIRETIFRISHLFFVRQSSSSSSSSSAVSLQKCERVFHFQWFALIYFFIYYYYRWRGCIYVCMCVCCFLNLLV